ncbi:MAG: glycosyltransferase [Planctomycetes bacterium]|nr:glycosyltransferase [Planctomycetota bacterium]
MMNDPRAANPALPLVSIGLPVYNGARHIAQALDSLLAQDYPRFELIICDNASTDATRAICEEYAARDRRVAYYRNETNLGAVVNFRRVFDLSSGEFFMWAGHHDLWEPTFISQCLNRLLEEPEAVLCFTPLRLIDANGACLGSYDENLNTLHLDRLGRLHVVLWRLRWQLGAGATIYGLFRSQALRAVGVAQNTYGADWALLAELSLLGPFVTVPEPLFWLRDPHPRTRTQKDQFDALDPANAQKELSYPFLSLTRAVVGRIAHARISWWKKPVLILDALYCLERKFRLHSEVRRACLRWLPWPGMNRGPSPVSPEKASEPVT